MATKEFKGIVAAREFIILVSKLRDLRDYLNLASQHLQNITTPPGVPPGPHHALYLQVIHLYLVIAQHTNQYIGLTQNLITLFEQVVVDADDDIGAGGRGHGGIGRGRGGIGRGRGGIGRGAGRVGRGGGPPGPGPGPGPGGAGGIGGFPGINPDD